MRLQEWIHHFEVGAGARWLKVLGVVLAFIAVASVYDVLDWQGFSSEESMETAQLARNLADGKGYVTESIRPLSLYLLQQAAPAGQSGQVLQRPVPDLSIPPLYPLLLAGAMKIMPMRFGDTQWWNYQPEHWIVALNQLIFFAALTLLFRVARRLFDSRVAWLSVILCGGTHLFWRFSMSGLSVCWDLLLFLALVWCLLRLDERAHAGTSSAAALFGLALAAGLVLALGGLSLYSFGWLLLPAVLFMASGAKAGRTRLCVGIMVGFLLVMGPWVARNVVLTGLPFGERTLVVAQETDPFPGDTLERSFNPQGGLRRVTPSEVINKLLTNSREFLRDQLPRLGGNWIIAFFGVGLMIPFQGTGRGRMRWFLIGSFVILFLAQVLGATHVTDEYADINSENLLVLLMPLVFVYGAAVFYTLLDQWTWATLDVRGATTSILVAVLCAPLIIALMMGRPAPSNSPYSPLQIRRTAQLFDPAELMTSDIPSGVAWYGNRACAWLPLDDARDYYQLNSLKPVKGLYLTQRTSDQRLLSEMLLQPKSWGYFLYQCEDKGEVPDNFPLTKSPVGFLPYQILLTDRARWR